MQVRLTREADRNWELAERLGRSAGVNLEWEPVRLTRKADRSWELAERLGRSAGVNLEWEPVKPPPSVSGRLHAGKTDSGGGQKLGVGGETWPLGRCEP
ncbi:hypothetical protein J6590_049412 [Homalodisca vitripennis]|nr:hypothetical protein J6590_049412 [Homalodisca vitripennis]